MGLPGHDFAPLARGHDLREDGQVCPGARPGPQQAEGRDDEAVHHEAAFPRGDAPELQVHPRRQVD